MSKTLVIVESPGKIKSVQSYLGDNYDVIASAGHIIDLPENELAVDIKNNFTPTFKPYANKKDIISKIKSKYASCGDILLATDKDREGEMIAWSIAYILGLKNPKRLVFKSITKSELVDAIKSPQKINENKVNAQKTRRILDRIVGYLISPLLWKNIMPKISAGRVQSVITKLIIEKESEIEKFVNEKLIPYFKFSGEFKHIDNMKCQLHEILRMEIDKTITEQAKINSLETAKELIENMQKSTYKVRDITYSTSKHNPAEPYSTSSMQQDACSKLGFSTDRTMKSAQILYEAGLITYMRTDSTELSQTAHNEIKNYINKKFGSEFYEYHIPNKKGKKTQDAHEAIRPVTISLEYISTNYKNNSKIGNSEVRLYNLIWKRTIASQMKAAIYDVMTVNISISKEKTYLFQSEYEKIKFRGYMAVYGEEKESKFMEIKIGDDIKVIEIVAVQDYPKPPSRYNEGMLVAQLGPKKLNIGRPATYAQMINKIQKIGYVEKKSIEGIKKNSYIITYNAEKDTIREQKSKTIINSEKDRLIPTGLGTIVTKYLEKRFPKIMDYKFTSDMENNLDEIEYGTKTWLNVLDDFYKDFKVNLDIVQKENPLIKSTYEKILGKDPETGENVIATIGSNGPYVKLSDTKYKIGPIKKPLTLDNIKLEDALKILEFPKIIGKIGNAIVYLKTNNGQYYVDVGGKRKSVPSKDITIEEVKELMNQQDKSVLKLFTEGTKVYEIREHKENGKYIMIKDMKTKKANVTFAGFPKGENINLDNMTLDLVKDYINKHYETKKNKYTKGKSKAKFKNKNKSKK